MTFCKRQSQRLENPVLARGSKRKELVDGEQGNFRAARLFYMKLLWAYVS